MNIKCSTETHCGITWERFIPNDGTNSAFITGDQTSGNWYVEYNSNGLCWSLYKDSWAPVKKLMFESTVLTLVFMIARELILNGGEDGFVPSWKA